MRLARAASRMLCVVAAAIVATACGGGDDRDGDGTSATRKVDRSGYFTSTQSEALNPVLAEYDAAFRALDTGHDACTRTAARLFEQGRPGRVAVKCHLDNTADVTAALDATIEAFEAIDGSDYRAACERQLEAMTTFLTDYRAAWTAVEQDWKAYAADKPVSEAKTQQHFNEAYKQNTAFVTAEAPALSKACYTTSDRDQAADASKDSAAAQDPDATS